MREIKFRYWNEQANRYHYGQAQVFACLLQQVTGQYNHESDGCMIEQFTGLHDKNGEEIYEGDVVQDSTGLCLVTWNPIFACFCLRRDGWMFDHFFGEAVDPFDCEVIGNIHENKDLLEGGN